MDNPYKFWRKYEEWIKPMNQLQNGLFFSINMDNKDFNYIKYCNEESNIKLEYYQLGPNYAKILFEYEDAFPYRISTGNKLTKNKIQLNRLF